MNSTEAPLLQLSNQSFTYLCLIGSPQQLLPAIGFLHCKILLCLCAMLVYTKCIAMGERSVFHIAVHKHRQLFQQSLHICDIHTREVIFKLLLNYSF